MYKAITISSDNGEFEISALIGSKGEYYAPSLTIFPYDDEKMDIWDNEDYLMQEFYPKLIFYTENKKHLICELDLIGEDNSEDILVELLEMFNEAVRMGIFKRK